MPTTRSVPRRAASHRRRSFPADLEPVLTAPSDMVEAFTALDRIAQYCVTSCEPVAERCVESRCRAWIAERAASEFLATRLYDLEG